MTRAALYLPQNATTDEQRREVIERLTSAWDDLTFWSFGEMIAHATNGGEPLLDTELVENVEALMGGGCGGCGGWRTFNNGTAETRAWLRAQALNAETRHTVDINELRRLGIIGEDE